MRRKPMDGPIWSGAGPNEKFVRPKSKKGEPRLRFSWNTPLVISHHNPLTFYCGANKVFKSLNRGDDWVCISPDLTPGQRGRISTLSESPLKIGLIYVGMGRGNVQVTLNDGVSWSDVSSGLPNKTINRVVASRHELQTVYAALSGKGEDEFGAYVYMSNDFGETWQSIVGNLPLESVNVIAEDPRDKDVLYTGTDLGVYANLDRG